jgi:hypothetical protein
MYGFVVKIEYKAGRQKPKNPMVTFHVPKYLLNRVTNAQHNVHRVPPFEISLILATIFNTPLRKWRWSKQTPVN